MSAGGRHDTTRLQGSCVLPIPAGSENNLIVSLVPCQTRNPPGTRETGGTTMTKLHILGVPALVLVMLAPDAMAQRRGGGAVSGGVRGAMVGGLVGGAKERRPVPRLAWLPALPGPALIEKLRGVPNTRRAPNTRMLLTRISIQHRHRCWSQPHRLRLRQRLQRQRPTERPSFARMVSPWSGSPIPRIGSR